MRAARSHYDTSKLVTSISRLKYKAVSSHSDLHNQRDEEGRQSIVALAGKADLKDISLMVVSFLFLLSFFY